MIGGRHKVKFFARSTPYSPTFFFLFGDDNPFFLCCKLYRGRVVGDSSSMEPLTVFSISE